MSFPLGSKYSASMMHNAFSAANLRQIAAGVEAEHERGCAVPDSAEHVLGFSRCVSKNSSSRVCLSLLSSLQRLLMLMLRVCRVQVIPRTHTNHRLGSIVQRYHRPQWLRHVHAPMRAGSD